jgi:hypothetical protein
MSTAKSRNFYRCAATNYDEETSTSTPTLPSKPSAPKPKKFLSFATTKKRQHRNPTPTLLQTLSPQQIIIITSSSQSSLATTEEFHIPLLLLPMFNPKLEPTPKKHIASFKKYTNPSHSHHHFSSYFF